MVLYNPPPNNRRLRQEYEDNNNAMTDIIADMAISAHRAQVKLLTMGDFSS